MRDYAGSVLRYEGTAVVLLQPGNTDYGTYTPVEWHHDRCGRRLKLYVFLSDVTEDSFPTQVALKSNNLWYYYYTGGVKARHPHPDFVSSQYEVKSMLGKPQGGFIFDTNSLHRAKPIGTKDRFVLAAEFHAHGKMTQLYGRGLPCPDQAKTILPTNRGGLPGFKFFPQEGGIFNGPRRDS